MDRRTATISLAHQETMSERKSDTTGNATGQRRKRTTTKKKKRTYKNATRMLEIALSICATSAAMLALAIVGVAGSLEVGRANVADFMLKFALIAVPLFVLGVIITRLDRTLNEMRGDRRRK